MDRVTLLSGYSYFALMVIIPGRLQRVNGHDALHAGLHLIPMLAATAVGSFVGGAINSKKNLTFYTLIASATLQVLGIGLLTTLRAPTADLKAQYGFQALIGFGVGLCFAAGTVLTSLQVPSGMLATGHGILSQARILGGCIGIAVCTVVLQATAKKEQQFGRGADGGADQRAIYAEGFYENVKIMLYLAAAAVVVSISTAEANPPQMQNIQAHRVDLDKEEEAGRVSVSSGVSGNTELQDLANRTPVLPGEGRL
jgi:MFS family permease